MDLAFPRSRQLSLERSEPLKRIFSWVDARLGVPGDLALLGILFAAGLWTAGRLAAIAISYGGRTFTPESEMSYMMLGAWYGAAMVFGVIIFIFPITFFCLIVRKLYRKIFGQ